MPAAAFLDRDGTIIDQTNGYINYPEQMACVDFLPGAVDAIRRLQENGYQLHVVTNQGGVGAGFLSETSLAQIHMVLWDRLRDLGVHLQSIKSCKHKPDAGCECRKPKPGMILEIAHRFDVDLHRSIMIGNDVTDVQAGQAAGCASYLLTRWDALDLGRPAAIESATL
jgi:D-glycero-D-manno-heptose 1,7-bisphosphate phosphatase